MKAASSVAVVAALGACIKEHEVQCGDQLCPLGWHCSATGCAAPFDAQFFDAPADAPFACPPIGQVPMFSVDPKVVVTGDSSYTIAVRAGFAVGTCGNLGVCVGPIDGVMTAAPGFDDPNKAFRQPRATPEGDIIVITHPIAVGSYSLERYRRAVDGTWSSAAVLPIAVTVDTNIGTPSSGPNAHIVVADTSAATRTEHLLDTGANLRTTSAPYDMGEPNLTPDGLRMVFSASPDTFNYKTYYADRATIDDDFGTATQLNVTPPYSDAYMTEDCGRLYFTTDNGIVYANQQ